MNAARPPTKQNLDRVEHGARLPRVVGRQAFSNLGGIRVGQECRHYREGSVVPPCLDQIVKTAIRSAIVSRDRQRREHETIIAMLDAAGCVAGEGGEPVTTRRVGPVTLPLEVFAEGFRNHLQHAESQGAAVCILDEGNSRTRHAASEVADPRERGKREKIASGVDVLVFRRVDDLGHDFVVPRCTSHDSSPS